MDYQRNGRFRPTCGVPYRTAVSSCPTKNYDCPTTPHHDEHHANDTWHMDGTSLSMVVSPKQSYHKLYEPDKALCRGTLFAELDKPFTGKCEGGHHAR